MRGRRVSSSSHKGKGQEKSGLVVSTPQEGRNEGPTSLLRSNDAEAFGLGYDGTQAIPPATLRQLSQNSQRTHAQHTQFNLTPNPTTPHPNPPPKTTMDPATQLSRLIGDIHDAAPEPSRWSEVVGKAGRSVADRRRRSFPKARSPAMATSITSSAPIPDHRQLYFEKYVNLDPATSGHHFAEIGDAMAVEDSHALPRVHADAVLSRVGASAGHRRFPLRRAGQIGRRRRAVRRVSLRARRHRRRRGAPAHAPVVPHICRAVLLGWAIEGWSGDAAVPTCSTISAPGCVCSPRAEKSSTPIPPATPFSMRATFSPPWRDGSSPAIPRSITPCGSCLRAPGPSRQSGRRTSRCRCGERRRALRRACDGADISRSEPHEFARRGCPRRWPCSSSRDDRNRRVSRMRSRRPTVSCPPSRAWCSRGPPRSAGSRRRARRWESRKPPSRRRHSRPREVRENCARRQADLVQDRRGICPAVRERERERAT